MMSKWSRVEMTKKEHNLIIERTIRYTKHVNKRTNLKYTLYITLRKHPEISDSIKYINGYVREYKSFT